MTFLLVVLIVLAAGAVVFALVRGLHAFANMKPAEVDENGIPHSLNVQNKAMFARVKYQALAVLLIVVLLTFFKAG
jgi:Hypoxia induced protein conserved region